MTYRTEWFQALSSLALLAAGLLLATAAVSGCGKGGGKDDGSPKDDAAHKTPVARKNARPADNGGHLAAGSARRGVWINNGQKYYNKHPYDIWFGNAYQVAADARPVGGGETGKTVATAPMKKAGMPGVAKKTAAPAAGDWKSLVSGEALDAEMKRIAIFCRERLLTVARYSTSFKEIRNNAAALSAVAQIGSGHPDPVPWKDDALYLRDLGLKLSETATERGTAKFKLAKELFEKIDDILKKNKPAGLSEPRKDASFSDVAGRGGLMRRMEAAHKWLKAEIKTEEQFKAKAPAIAQEATMLGVMARVIGDKSYDSADEAAYAQHVSTTVEETQKIVSATRTGNFAAFQPALDRIYNQCTQCHDGFR